MKKPNECDMDVELTIKNAWIDEDLWLHDGKVALTVTSVPNCKVAFVNTMDAYFEDLTEEDDLIVWASKYKKHERVAFADHIKRGKYKLNKLVMCNERYVEDDARIDEDQ